MTPRHSGATVSRPFPKIRGPRS